MNKRSKILFLLLAFTVALQCRSATTANEDAAEPSARFTGSQPLPALPAGAFTVVVIPDTQHYIGAGCKRTRTSTEPVTNPHLEAQVKWIREHQKDQNIVFVSHVGDIVDYNRPEEWAVARQHLDTLRGVVPFGLSVGNHDMKRSGDARLFQQHFPAASFRQYSWCLGCYEHTREDKTVSANNANSAQVFRGGGLDFIHLNLECNAPDDVLAWANDLIAKHPQRRALITTHMDLGIRDKPKTTEGYIKDPKGRMRWAKCHGTLGNSAEQMWEKCYRKHATLAMVFSGDQSRVTAMRESRTGDKGNTIHFLLSDYMSQPVLRLYRFVTAENKVHVLTYEVKRRFLVETTNYVRDPTQHQFTLSFASKAVSSSVAPPNGFCCARIPSSPPHRKLPPLVTRR